MDFSDYCKITGRNHNSKANTVYRMKVISKKIGKATIIEWKDRKKIITIGDFGIDGVLFYRELGDKYITFYDGINKCILNCSTGDINTYKNMIDILKVIANDIDKERESGVQVIDGLLGGVIGTMWGSYKDKGYTIATFNSGIERSLISPIVSFSDILRILNNRFGGICTKAVVIRLEDKEIAGYVYGSTENNLIIKDMNNKLIAFNVNTLNDRVIDNNISYVIDVKRCLVADKVAYRANNKRRVKWVL